MSLQREWGRGMVIALGLLLLSVFFVPAWAAESDVVKLIKLLQEKNIVTSQEAESLLKEVTVNAKEEKEAIKAEVKDELTKAGQKGDFLPSALKGFKFGTTVFAGWEAMDRSDPGSSYNRFYVERAHFTLSKDFNDWLGITVVTDLFQFRDNTQSGTDWAIRLKNAYVRLNFFDTTTHMGMIPTFSEAYDSAIWPYRVQSRNFLDEMGVQATIDFGISNQGVFGGYMDADYLKFASKPFAGKWGGWMVGVSNGAGYTTEEGNGNKAVSALVYFRPAPMVPILKGLQLAYMGTYGKSNRKFTAAYGSTDDNPDWRVNLVQASLQHAYFTVLGQYYWGQGTRQSQEELDRRGYLVAGFMRIPSLEKMRVFGKYYYIDPDSSNETATGLRASQYKTYVAGLSYDVTNEFMPFIAYERRDYNKELSATTADYNKYQVGFQFKF